jgi:hypothetical protein
MPTQATLHSTSGIQICQAFIGYRGSLAHKDILSSPLWLLSLVVFHFMPDCHLYHLTNLELTNMSDRMIPNRLRAQFLHTNCDLLFCMITRAILITPFLLYGDAASAMILVAPPESISYASYMRRCVPLGIRANII